MYRNSKAFSGPKLPRTLLDQVDKGASNSAHGKPQNGRRSLPASRKDRRKVERQQAKARRVEPVHKRQKHEPVVQDDSSSSHDEPPPRPQTATTRKEEGLNKGNGNKTTSISVQDAKPKSAPVSKKTQERLEADDAEIAALEKKLGLKSKKLPKSFHDDGLGDLLDGLDDGDSDGQENVKRKRTEDGKWLENKRRKTLEDDVADAQDEDASDDEGGLEADSYDEELLDLDSDEIASDESSPDEPANVQKSNISPPRKRVRENPYIAPPTTDAPTKYIPPSRRAPLSEDAELNQRLRRQVQGLLNRLSDSNLVSIVNDTETLFQANPRQHVTATLIDILLALLCDRTSLNDTFLILHAGFISAMYKVLGQDFGAQMLEGIVRKIDEFYSASAGDANTGKETANLISLLAQLFNFQVTSSDILFDYIRIFLSSLSEFHTELLLRIVRTSGTQLRQDDPSSLKDIVLLLQKTVAATPAGQVSVRTQFMIETINDLKNNRLKTGAASSAVSSEHSTRMRKILGSLNSRGTLRASEPLRIPLDDVRNADKKGKWWLVGASWKGNATPTPSTHPSHPNDKTPHPAAADDSDTDILAASAPQPHNLAALAQRNGMNNPLRRSIFAALVSASDCRDAHTRLVKLRLSRAQEREIPRVVLHCAATEPAYNPYYALVARRLCSTAPGASGRKMRVAFQFALWDFVKRIGAGDGAGAGAHDDGDGGEPVGMRALVHYAKLYGALIAAGALGVVALKTVDVAALAMRADRGGAGAGSGNSAATFLEVLLITVLTQVGKGGGADGGAPATREDASGERAQKLDVRSVFAPAMEVPALAAGLRAFVRRVVKGSDLVSSDKERRRVRRGCEAIEHVLGSAPEVSSGMVGAGSDEDDDGYGSGGAEDVEVEWDEDD